MPETPTPLRPPRRGVAKTLVDDGCQMLFGVTNRGENDPDDLCTGSSIFASIPFYRSWIEQVAAKPIEPILKTDLQGNKDQSDLGVCDL